MSPNLSKVIIPSASAILLIACTLTPIYNIDSAPIKPSSTTHDLSDVTKAIQRAGAGLGWRMKEVAPGHIVGALYWRSHLAVVDITHTLFEYSINYRDSTNLGYNGYRIHRNYNSRVDKLNNAVNVQLNAPGRIKCIPDVGCAYE